MTDAARMLPTRISTSAGRLNPAAVAILLAVALVALKPVGYVGGGGDDWHYLEAARCAAANGLCLAGDHWWARWPLVAPMGWAIAMFGDSRTALMIVPLIYASGALALFATLVERQFGRLAALVAGLALAVTPVVTQSMLRPNIDMVELCFMLAAALALQQAWKTSRPGLAALAGAALAIAAAARPTALAMVPIFAFALWRWRPRLLAAMLVGFALPVLLELIIYAAVTGDPLHAWKLALGHTSIASSQIDPALAASGSPLFNRAIIAGWKRPMGIEVHWTVDGLLNLLANTSISLVLVGPLVLLWLERSLARRDGAMLLWLLGAGAIYGGALIYAFAVDPQPRMFLPLAAAGAAIVGVLAPGLWSSGGKLIAAAFVLLLLVNGIIEVRAMSDFRAAESTAARWAHEERFAVDPGTSKFLALVPEIRALPIAGPSSPRVLHLALDHCPEGQVLRRATFPSGSETLALCLMGPPD